MTHWADVVAEELLERSEGPHVFATAITPSGPIHVGNMREVLTTEAIFRAVKERGAEAELIYIADDYDPLRKVYPFLEGHAHDYSQEVGKPLAEIPCPCGDHASYSEHFLEPFLSNLDELGVEPKVLSAYAMYGEGQYADATRTAFEQQETVRAIIEEVTGRQLPKRWAPFNPQCPSCRRIAGTEVTLFEFPEIHCICRACAEGTDDPDAGTFVLDVTQGGIGKLPWRVDWPARWRFLGVTFEAFGKDHGASGGSWDSGKRLVREVFDGEEPHHVMYEFLNLKGQGAMHSSTGLAVSASDMLAMTPPEVLRYLLVRQSPRKHIDFDPGLGLLDLVDEFDRFERVHFGVEENTGTFTEVERTYQLATPRDVPATMPTQVNVRHLVTVTQIAKDLDGVVDVLRRSGELGVLDDVGRARLAERVEHVQAWLERFAPDSVRFHVQPNVPEAVTDEDRPYLHALAQKLRDAEWTAQGIHDTIHATAGEVGISGGKAFKAVYHAILGKDRGPRAGFFLASQERDFVVERFANA